MTSQGSAHGRFQRAIASRNLLNAETAAREMGGLSLVDALALCELLAAADPKRYERAALRWLQRFIDERLPPVTEVALAASALAELRHGRRAVARGGAQTGCSQVRSCLRPSRFLLFTRYRVADFFGFADVPSGGD
jgi:glutathione S-transferase